MLKFYNMVFTHRALCIIPNYYIVWSFRLYPSLFFTKLCSNLDTCTLTTVPRSNASQKHSIHVEPSQKVIETNLILHSTPHAFCQASPDHSTVVLSDCVGIVLKQNNFDTVALPLLEIFASFYREELIEITKCKDSPAMYKMFKKGGNVSATIICEKGVGRPTH